MKRKKRKAFTGRNNALVKLPHCAAVRADELERYLFYIFKSAEDSLFEYEDRKLSSIKNVSQRCLTHDVLLIGKFLGRKYSKPGEGNGKKRRKIRHVRLLCDRKNRVLHRLQSIQERRLDDAQYPRLLR